MCYTTVCSKLEKRGGHSKCLFIGKWLNKSWHIENAIHFMKTRVRSISTWGHIHDILKESFTIIHRVWSFFKNKKLTNLRLFNIFLWIQKKLWKNSHQAVNTGGGLILFACTHLHILSLVTSKYHFCQVKIKRKKGKLNKADSRIYQ